MDVCRAANPRLRIRRARFSALIPRDIHQVRVRVRVRGRVLVRVRRDIHQAMRT